MYKRNIVEELRKWRNSPQRKPLVLRGARQVGKTTVVEQFAADFSQFIHLNLERDKDREIFTQYHSASEVLQMIFLQYNSRWEKRCETLLFIDEIQESPEAVAILRYFYEEFPEIYVIAAGSLLETIFDKGINFPVGRVEYRALRPFSFAEFLEAMGENQAFELYSKVPMPDFAYSKLLQLFHTYTLVGGMPEVLKIYIETRDLTLLRTIYESLLATYFSDAEKYAKNQNQVQIIRHAVKAIFYEAGSRIKFAGFGASNYGSKEMGEVLRTLERVMLLHLIFPTTQTEQPFIPDIKKSPRLQALDTGMLNFISG
jgi:predicted AAA+ superfamily ATPase